MSDSIITKHALANALKDLMKSRPFNKINVGEICKKCSMNRKTFYYHFKDKYDLVNWIYYTEFEQEFSQKPAHTSWESLLYLCQYLYENQEFYRNALEITGQNSFYEYFGELLIPYIATYLNPIFEDDIHRHFYVDFFCDATRIAIVRWINSGATLSPQEFVHMVRKAATGMAVKIVEQEDL